MYKPEVPERPTSTREPAPIVPDGAPEFVRTVTAAMMAGRGDDLPVSAMPVDGTFPSATTQWEKRNVALEVPIWEPDICIQCGKCVLVCPHAVIRSKVVSEAELAGAPEGFKTADARWREYPDKKYTLQVSMEDCTGCTLCVEVCPAKDKSVAGRKAINMHPIHPVLEEGRKHWTFFDKLPEQPHVDSVKYNNVKNIQLLEPLFGVLRRMRRLR